MKSCLVAAALLSSAFLVACDQEPTPPTKATVPAVVNQAVKKVEEATNKAADKAADTAKEVSDKTAEVAKDTADAAKSTSIDAAEAAKKAANDAAKEVGTSAAATEAQALIDQVTKDIRAKNFESAEAALKKLEEIKPSLPESLQGKINSLRDGLTAAKTADAAKVPESPMK